MNALLTDPHALYVYCDGAMDYDRVSSGGVGFEIVFPDSAHCRLTIDYGKRKYLKSVDKLAKVAKYYPIAKDNIATKRAKIGRRKYKGVEVKYNFLKEKEEFHVHIYKKDPVRDQWEISAEICEGAKVGMKLKIYTDDKLATKLNRLNEFGIRKKNVFAHHITIYKTIHRLKKLWFQLQS